MDIVVAERALVAESPEGERSSVRVIIGRPFKVADQTWSCPLRLDGLGSVSDGLGVDSWSALTVAIGVVHQNLTTCIEQGMRLMCANDDTEIDLDDLFPRF